MPDESSNQWLNDLIEGKGEAAGEFVRAFGPALQKIAASNMTPALQRKVGADDVFQSVCRTFFRRANDGHFTLPDRDSLWRLLCAITLNKVRMHSRFFSAMKRGPLEATPIEENSAAAKEVSVEDAAAFADEFAKLMQSLGPTEGELIRLKIEGYSHAEIAERLSCTERTVGRLLVKSRQILKEQLAEPSDT